MPRARPLTTVTPFAAEVGGEVLSRLPPVRRRFARPYHGHRDLIVGRQLAADVKHRRLVIDLLETRRVLGVVPRIRPHPRFFESRDFVLGRDRVAFGDDAGDTALVDARRVQLARTRFPRRLHAAEVRQ